MAFRNQFAQFKHQVIALTWLSILTFTFAFPIQAYALEENATLPTLPEFIQTVKDGNPNALRGIYVAGVMAYPIIQQPMGYPGYVSEAVNTVTQFSIASEVGNLGLLAHNYLAGANFFQIVPDNIITLVYGDGRTQSFLVGDIQRYQALSPLSPYSDFRDLETESILTAEQLFNQVYRGEFHLTLQTCIESEGNSSWGRLFIIAKPVIEKSIDPVNFAYIDV